jgi:hypothetical protein
MGNARLSPQRERGSEGDIPGDQMTAYRQWVHLATERYHLAPKNVIVRRKVGVWLNEAVRRQTCLESCAWSSD